MELKWKKRRQKECWISQLLKESRTYRSFLRLDNYYQQFIKDFIFIAKLLHDLVKKDQKWDQIEKQKKVFRKLKKRFAKKSVLVVLNLDLRNENGS